MTQLAIAALVLSGTAELWQLVVLSAVNGAVEPRSASRPGQRDAAAGPAGAAAARQRPDVDAARHRLGARPHPRRRPRRHDRRRLGGGDRRPHLPRSPPRCCCSSSSRRRCRGRSGPRWSPTCARAGATSAAPPGSGSIVLGFCRPQRAARRRRSAPSARCWPRRADIGEAGWGLILSAGRGRAPAHHRGDAPGPAPAPAAVGHARLHAVRPARCSCSVLDPPGRA